MCVPEAFTMRTLIVSFVATALSLSGCGGSYPVPTQAMADAESAERSATELGAANEPQGQLHLRLADEQLGQAKRAVARQDNERAASLLIRSKADSELAIAIARAQNAKVEAQKASEQLNAQSSTNAAQGAHQ
jgi:hypothetical protein